ncbi:unknown [Clostridium sp. CAG:352]|nr:unknown [Clostridium sp. CAG:352]
MSYVNKTVSINGTEKDFIKAFANELDKIIFGVKEDDVNSDNSKYIIKKIATSKDKINEGYGIYFVPSDTLNLEHKNYFYDVGIQTSDGKYYMTTECSIFKVRRAITSKE